jgi:hypothetical protein
VALPPTGTDDRAEQKQIELLRAAGPVARAERARRLSIFVIGLSRRAIRTRYPELSEREVLLKFVELHYGADLADRLRAYLARRER